MGASPSPFPPKTTFLISGVASFLISPLVHFFLLVRLYRSFRPPPGIAPTSLFGGPTCVPRFLPEEFFCNWWTPAIFKVRQAVDSNHCFLPFSFSSCPLLLFPEFDGLTSPSQIGGGLMIIEDDLRNLPSSSSPYSTPSLLAMGPFFFPPIHEIRAALLRPLSSNGVRKNTPPRSQRARRPIRGTCLFLSRSVPYFPSRIEKCFETQD